jgi:hypothetical protein
MTGFYTWLHTFLRHILSAAPSCWPDSAKPPTGKRGLKYGGAKRSSPLETMALAGILASGYDNLKWRDRKFLQISDDYEGGMINLPELYAQLDLYLPKFGPWTAQKYLGIKRKINRRVIRLRRK